MSVTVSAIHTDADLDIAIERLDEIFDASEGAPEGEEAEILMTLVEAYERTHAPIDPPDPVDAILFRMDQGGLTRKDLEPYIGRGNRVAEIMNRKRRLSLEMIRRLHEGLGIPLESLVHPYELAD
jgi:HTH-type transcriptional regulator / antitoxin HigA